MGNIMSCKSVEKKCHTGCATSEQRALLMFDVMNCGLVGKICHTSVIDVRVLMCEVRSGELWKKAL
jgi:hypothetical protein